MSTLTVRFSRCGAAVGAALITAIGAWAFVNSSASADRDPFQFAAVMAANAELHSVQLQSRNDAPACRTQALSPACVAIADTRGPAAP